MVNKQELIVRAMMGKGVSSWDQTKLAFIKIQWLMDRRKTKAETEERSVQDCAIRVFKDLQHMANKAGPEEVWKARALELGEAMGDLLRVLEGVELGVEVDDFPRAMYQASLEKLEQRENRHTEQRQEETTEHNTHGEGRPQQENNMSEAARGRNARGQETYGEEIRRYRQFPQAPGARRPNPDSRAYGGWDVIDSLTIT